MSQRSKRTELVGWFHPFSGEDHRLPGTLEITPAGETTLRIINDVKVHPAGSFFEMPSLGFPLPWHLSESQTTILGTVSGKTPFGKAYTDAPVTLDGCRLLTIGSFQEPRHIRFAVNTAYIGIAFPSTDAILCNELLSRITGIEGWLNPSGPTGSPPSAVDFAPKPLGIEADIPEIGNLAVKLGILRHWSRARGNAYEIRESGYVVLKPSKETPWEDMRKALKAFHRFLCFALNRLCTIQQVKVGVDGQEVEVIERGRNEDSKPYRPDQVSSDALFTADGREAGVVGPPLAVLRRWLEIPPNAQGTLVRLHSLMQPNQFLDTQAVTLCGAAELWQKHVLEEANDLGTAHEAVALLEGSARTRVEKIFMENGWGGVYERRIRPVLDDPNLLSTGKRVKAVFDPIERRVLGLDQDDRPEVSSGLLGVRHPVVHGGLPEMKVEEMARLVFKARSLLKLRILEFLGVDWQATAQYNRTLRWELGLDEQSSHALPYPIYAGVPPLDATLLVLENTRDWMTLREVATALQGGGLTFQKSAVRVISNYLTTCLKAGGPLERTATGGKVRWRWCSRAERDEREADDTVRVQHPDGGT